MGLVSIADRSDETEEGGAPPHCQKDIPPDALLKFVGVDTLLLASASAENVFLSPSSSMHSAG